MSWRSVDSDRVRRFAPAIFGIAVAILLVSALCPTVFLGDSGELSAAIATGGVAHPPGYPLFSILGSIACRLIPFGEPAWRIGLVGVVGGALAAAFSVGAARRAGATTTTAVAASFTLVTSVPFGIQTARVEVYGLSAGLFSLWLLGAMLVRDCPRSRWGMLFWFSAGLCLAHHTTSILALPGLLWLCGTEGRKKVLQLPCLAWGMVGPALYFELLRRGWTEPLLDWGGIRDFSSLWRHATAALYRSWLRWPDPASFARVFAILHSLLPWPLLCAAAVGLLLRPVEILKTAVPLCLAAIPGILFATAYAIPDLAPHLFLPALAALPLVAIGLDRLASAVPRKFGRAVVPVALVLLALRAVASFPQWDLSGALAARELAVGKLQSCPPDAVLLTSGDNDHFPLMYARDVLKVRRDVVLISRDMLRHGSANRFREPSMWYVKSLGRHGIPIAVNDRPDAGEGASDDAALIALLDGPWRSRPVCTTFVRAAPAGAGDPLLINDWMARDFEARPRGLVVELVRRENALAIPYDHSYNALFWNEHRLPSLAGVRGEGEVTPDYIARYYAAMLRWTASASMGIDPKWSTMLMEHLRSWVPDLADNAGS